MWRAAASSLLLPRRPSLAAAVAAYTKRNLCLLAPSPTPTEAEFTPVEARRMVRLVGVELLKRRLRASPDEVVGYGEFLDACVDAGAARTRGQAEELARAMDQSGSVVLFRGKVYLHPEPREAATKAIFGEIERQMRDRQDEMVSHGELINTLLESSLKRTEAEALVRKMDDTSLVMLVRGKTYCKI